MPQKQPPATTAVCSPLLVAIGASTAGYGTAEVALSPALQAITPAKVTIKSAADMRERLLITIPPDPVHRSSGLDWLESGKQRKLQRELSQPVVQWELFPGSVTLLLAAHLIAGIEVCRPPIRTTK